MSEKTPASRNRKTADEQAGNKDEAKPGTAPEAKPEPRKPREAGGPAGPDPTRYGDWERKGILSDF